MIASLSQELLRYVVVLVAMPIWLPFVKELWKELNRALRWEGGLLGKPPTPQEREELVRLTLEEEDSLVNEPLANRRAGGGSGGFRAQKAPPRGGAAPRRPQPGARPGQGPGARPGTGRRGGFR